MKSISGAITYHRLTSGQPNTHSWSHVQCQFCYEPQCQGSWFVQWFCLWPWLRRASSPMRGPSCPKSSRKDRWSSCCNPVLLLLLLFWHESSESLWKLYSISISTDLSDRVRPGKSQLSYDVETHQSEFEGWILAAFFDRRITNISYLCCVWKTFAQQPRASSDPTFWPVIVTKHR